MNAARISRPSAVRDRDVLQIRIGRRETAGRGAHLVEGGVHAALGIGEAGKLLRVVAAQLASWRYSSTSAGTVWCSASSSSTSCAVETTLPLPYFIGFGRASC